MPALFNTFFTRYSLFFYTMSIKFSRYSSEPGKVVLKTEIFFSSTLMWNATLEEMFTMAVEHGFAGMEIWAQHFEFRKYSIEKYLRYSKMYDIESIVHSHSWDINLASMSEPVRQASLEETRKAVDFALLTNSRELTVHPGHLSHPQGKKPSLDRLYDSLSQIQEYAYLRGINISLEVMEKIPIMLAYSEKTIQMVTRDLYESFSYTVDAAHCDNEEELFYLLRALPHVSKVHISNRSGSHLHTPLFEGDHDFNTILPRLGSIGIPMVVEGLDTGRNFDILASTADSLAQLIEYSRYSTGSKTVANK